MTFPNMPDLSAAMNPDGTVNGIKFLSRAFNVSEAEVAWTCERIRVLLHEEKLPVDVAKRRVKMEALMRPWERGGAPS